MNIQIFGDVTPCKLVYPYSKFRMSEVPTYSESSLNLKMEEPQTNTVFSKTDSFSNSCYRSILYLRKKNFQQSLKNCNFQYSEENILK